MRIGIIAVVAACVTTLSARGQRPSVADGDPPAVRQVWIEHEAEPLPSPQPEPRVVRPCLTDFEALAMRSHPALENAAAAVRAARGRYMQAGLPPNPVAGYQGMEIGNVGTAGQQGGFVSQRFITGGKLAWSRSVAAEEIRIAHWRYETEKLRVLGEVRLRFYETLFRQRRMELAEELSRIARNSARATQTLLDNGQSTENNLLLAQNDSDVANLAHHTARDQYLEAWRTLAAAAAAPDLPLTPVGGDLENGIPDLEWEDVLNSVLAESPELAAAWAEVGRSRSALERAGVEWIPDVDVSVSVRHHNVSGDDVADVRVGLPLPLFNRNQGGIQQARAELTMAKSAAARLELDLQQRLASSYRRFTNARRLAERYRDQILPRAKKSLYFVTNGYRRGQVDYLTLLTSQKAYFQAEITYLSALWDLRRSLVEFNSRLVGVGRDASATHREP